VCRGEKWYESQGVNYQVPASSRSVQWKRDDPSGPRLKETRGPFFLGTEV
jgi:hypothetical protein